MNEQRPMDTLAWQEILYRLQHLETKMHEIQDHLISLKKEITKQPKVLTWRDVP